ncbi:MAG: neutral zinc metallopeptidase [Thermoanaerobaculia bacterium]
MRWTIGGRSADLDDMRGGGGGFGAMPKLGCGGFVVLLLLSLIFKRDFFSMVTGSSGTPAGPVQGAPPPTSPQEETQIKLVSAMVDDVQTTWDKIFAASNQQYSHARVGIFTNTVRSGCGFAESAMGPFYCPADQRVYIDLGFYNELRDRFHAAGDFAQAYVLAHEIGHHVQNVLGISEKVQRAQQSDSSSANDLSVRLELQADCFAGVWAHSTQGRGLEEGDIDEALTAASAVGDDRIQQQTTGEVNPETWTHGSAADRSRWFHTGFESGDIDSCDTFK